MKDLIADILASIERYPNNHAFVIDGKAHTYEELGQKAAGVYACIASSEEPAIGIVAGNDIDTYAAILGVLFSGKTYVILHPSFPQDRNLKIIAQADLRTIIAPSNSEYAYLTQSGAKTIDTKGRTGSIRDIAYNAPEQSNAYIIFTSGSTGEPKGVPISRGNLNAFYTAYEAIGWKLGPEDRMLQMFELTFDVSVVSTLYPLALGASVYTIGHKEVKYVKVFELLEEHSLTFAAVAPSVLQLISPYFDEIELPKLRYLVVTAEASQAELLERFRPSIPNAEIYNLYGPTEATIYCTYYQIPRIGIKQHNGMVAIGKPFAGTDTIITDEQGQPLPAGEKGEMWVSGPQVMAGYYNDPQKTAEAMVTAPDGKLYYKTGDLCIMDPGQDIIYCGRKDYQVKIQGFRIELSEIEYTAKQFFAGAHSVVVIPVLSAGICSELHMAIETAQCDQPALMKYLAEKLPYYMLPKKIHCIAAFPTSASNKTDRKQIAQIIHSDHE